jgi:3-oxoacyl-[acyl-carrier protein] reductase
VYEKMLLKDRVAVITGGSQGIGLAIAKALAGEGAQIAIVDVLEEQAQSVATELAKTFKVKAGAFKCDISDFDASSKMIDEVKEVFGTVDILVNNAGITRDGLILRMSEEQWDSVMAVNLKGVFNCTRHVSPIMLRNRRGSIINITSVVGQMGNKGQSNYAASKAGIIGFTKTIARELGGKKVRSNAVAPGYIMTEMTSQLPEEAQKELKKIIPMKQLGTPEDIAQTVLFLASDNSQYITGQTIAVNGGMYM